MRTGGIVGKNSSTSRNIEKLKTDATIALSGADYVKEKLSSLAAMGPRPLFDEVYAIKLRTKSVTSLASKVHKKRTKPKDPKPKYKAADATDIVGMRLLSLFAGDLPKVTRSLLSFIKFCQTPQIALIAGDTLNDGIREVIIYQSKQAENADTYEQIYRYCKTQPIDEFYPNGKKKISIMDPKETGKPYSSVHIVVDSISYSGGAASKIPVEIQIRSLFEDAWGEIDHQLEYKLDDIVDGDIPEDIQPVHDAFREMLKGLKPTLEQVGSTAEKIRSGYNVIFSKLPSLLDSSTPAPYELSPVHRSDDYEKDIRLSRRDDAEAEFTDKFEELLIVTKEIRAEIYQIIESGSQADQLITKISTHTDQLNILSSELESKKLFGKVTYSKTRYFLKMEEALCYYQLYSLSDHFYPQLVETNVQYIEKALDIYFLLEKSQVYRDDVFLNFRLGAVLTAKDNSGTGDGFLYKALEFLHDDKRMNGSLFSAIIPHMTSYAVWQRRSSLLELGYKSNNPRINREAQIDAVSESLHWALISKFKLSQYTGEHNTWYKEVKRDIANNIISFIWELRDLSNVASDFQSRLIEIIYDVQEEIESIECKNGYQIISLQECGALLEREKTDDTTDIRLLDSLMKFYCLIGNQVKMKEMYGRMETELGDEKLKKHVPMGVYNYYMDRIKTKGSGYALPKNIMLH